jgi:predicted nucleotidyltransferase component of viral defense system
MSFEHRLTKGHVLRHIPPASTVSQDIALLDIAQDFALTHLHTGGFFELAVFKGGTALRKLFAGSAGRFSTDIDFALADQDGDRDTVASLAAELVDGVVLGPFRFSASLRRGRWLISVGSEFGDIPVPLKLDVGPPCWLTPQLRPFVPAPVHARYDFQLPMLPTMRLEENMAEKIARLNRVSAARDASDLVWVTTTPPHSQLDRALTRKLAVLKTWADTRGLGGQWRPADGAGPFDPHHWLRTGRDWDDESIGLLAHPPPPLEQLEHKLVQHWGHLTDLSDDERRFAQAAEIDRAAIVGSVSSLPDAAVTADALWRPPAVS